MARLEGAYSVSAVVEGTLVAFRDPHGIRPLSIGRLGEDWVLASETCAFDLIGARFERDVRPGEVVLIDEDGLHATQALPEGRHALCIFEHVYFARPDSTLAGSEVHGVRVRMGATLAAEAPVEADLVMPIPDSGTPAGVGFSRASGIPYSEGLIKNRYVGRTFIEPDEGLREQGIRMKFNPLAEVEGKRLVIVDDSIVRGSTMKQLVAMLLDSGAAEVHVRISSPPIVSPCFYGIDMADEEQLAAAHRSVEQMRELIGASSLALPLARGHAGGDPAARSSRCAAPASRATTRRGFPRPEPGEAPLRSRQVAPSDGWEGLTGRGIAAVRCRAHDVDVKIVVRHNEAGQWWWAVLGENGQTVAVSVPLASKTDCAKAIAELKVEGPVAPVAYEDDVTGPARKLARRLTASMHRGHLRPPVRQRIPARGRSRA